MEEVGFYKLINDKLFFGDKVQNKLYLLTVNQKDQYQYPVDGWYYFDTREEAETFFASQGWVKPEEPEV